MTCTMALESLPGCVCRDHVIDEQPSDVDIGPCHCHHELCSLELVPSFGYPDVTKN